MILHLCFPSKFLKDFVTFARDHLGSYTQEFLIVCTAEQLKESDRECWELLAGPDFPFGTWFYADARGVARRNLSLFRALYGSSKIIIHGLFLPRRITQILAYSPFLAKKSFWLMWGGDFYFREKQTPAQRRIIREVGHLVTYIPGDVDYVVDNYGAVGMPVDCLCYPSNIFRAIPRTTRADGKVRIQVGNSATESNRHIEVFSELVPFRDKDIEIICPLSYGDEEYSEQIQGIGRAMFGDRFIPVRQFLPYDEYLELLESIDIAIFNHDRQQGMGNIISHLGCGHKVYLRSDQTPWSVFVDRGIRVFDIADGVSLEHEIMLDNQVLVETHFSADRLVQQWKRIFEM